MKTGKILLVSIITVWAILIGISFVWLTDYLARPGVPANVAVRLPSGVFTVSKAKTPKLLLFIHPQCPCSRATLSELERIVGANQNPVRIEIVFYKPENKSSDWAQTDLWQKAREISGVQLLTMNEAEIEKFGVVTSGQTLLYDADENLVFSGGITGGRGHEGSNAGREAVETYLGTGNMTVGETPVYGCILTSPTRTPE